MKALTFTLRDEPPERLDLSPLTPQGLAGLDMRDIEKIRLGQSKRASTVGDIFRMSGSDPGNIVFDGGSSRFDGVATGLTDGAVRVAGDVGAQAGRAMRGGQAYGRRRCRPACRVGHAGRQAGDHRQAPATISARRWRANSPA